MKRDVIYFIILLIFVIIYCYIRFKSPAIEDDKIKLQDTTYNTVVLDSIVYNIQVKDSIIYNIKYKKDEDITKAINADDSTTVMLFQELLSN